MAQDYDGNTLQVGDKVWIPATVSSIGLGGIVNVTTAYNSQNVAVQANVTRKPRNFPDAP